MLQLSRSGIRSLAANEAAYIRGVQYFRENKIIHAAWANTAKQYRLTVQGNYPYQVIIHVHDDGSFDTICNCPAHIKEKGACKHIVASLLFLLRRQERATMSAPTTEEEKRLLKIIDYFKNSDELSGKGDIYYIEPLLTIPSMLKADNGTALLSLYAGNTRLYKIQALKKFLLDYFNGETIVLGKEFKFIHGESEFDNASVTLLEQLIGIYDIADILEQGNNPKLFLKNSLSMNQKMLLRFLAVFEQLPITLELYGKTYNKVRFKKGNPEIAYDMFAEEDAISFNYKDIEPVVPITADGSLLYYDGFIYQPDARFKQAYLPFYNNLGANKKPLVFHGEYRSQFLEYVLPKIHDILEIAIPDELKEHYLDLPLSVSIYFDRYNHDIKAEVRYRYGDYEINSFEDAPVHTHIIMRKKEQELQLIHLLEEYGFEPHSKFYLLKRDADIYRFITEGIEHLKEHADLYYSEEFKKMRSKKASAFRLGLNLSEDNSLLEMNLEYGDLSRQELKELFHSFKLKKKYYRLQDGTFIDLDTEDFKQMNQLFESINLSYKDMDGDGPLKLSKGNALYLASVLENTDVEFSKSQNVQELLDKIYSNEPMNYQLPQGIRADLRPYQQTGYFWLRMLTDLGFGGILADDMGLGKTLQAIVYMSALLQEPETKGCKFLIVCPTSLVFNWLDEIENFAPERKACVITGTPQERKECIEKLSEYEIGITSYPLIRRDIQEYQNLMFHTVFLDEAQFIKNAASVNAQSVKQLQTQNRFALTGTPIENSLSELWSIFDFIMPKYLLTHSKFMEYYEKPVLRGDTAAAEQLNKKIQPFVLRRMKKDVLEDLPEKIETKLLTEMTEEQSKVYLSYMAQVRSELVGEIDRMGIGKSQLQILAALTRLRQICCHPATFIENYGGGSGKLDLLMQILPELLQNQHRILIFSQFTSMFDLIKPVLEEANIEYFCLEGATKISTRNDYVRRFNQGEGSVFLVSLKAGGTGLNLIGADTVIHFDPWWNPAVEDQATDRVHRIGQKQTVHVIKLLTKGTIEEKIYKLQKRKKELSDSIIEAKETFLTSLTKEELESLLTE